MDTVYPGADVYTESGLVGQNDIIPEESLAELERGIGEAPLPGSAFERSLYPKLYQLSRWIKTESGIGQRLTGAHVLGSRIQGDKEVTYALTNPIAMVPFDIITLRTPSSRIVFDRGALIVLDHVSALIWPGDVILSRQPTLVIFMI